MGHIIITTPSNIITHGQFCKTPPIVVIISQLSYSHNVHYGNLMQCVAIMSHDFNYCAYYVI